MNQTQTFDYLFKINLAGDYKVGKTSLLERFVDVENENKFSSIGVDFRIKCIDIEGKVIKLQVIPFLMRVWDVVGSQAFGWMKRLFRNAKGAILVYSIDNRDSFENLGLWLNHINEQNSEDIPKMLIGNKNDLEDKRVVSIDEGQEFAQKHNMEFFEISVKTKKNLHEAFTSLAKSILKAQLNCEQNSNLKLANNTKNQNNQKVWC